MELTYTERKKGWWIEERSRIPCKLPRDGLIVVFNAIDIRPLLDANYPKNIKRKVWYFNKTRDREIAEEIDGEIFCNPTVLYDLGLLTK